MFNILYSFCYFFKKENVFPAANYEKRILYGSKTADYVSSRARELQRIPAGNRKFRQDFSFKRIGQPSLGLENAWQEPWLKIEKNNSVH